MSRIYALSTHADYRCGHSGACCTSGWPIPVERETFARLSDSLCCGTLAVDGLQPGRHAFVAPADAPSATPVVTGVRGDGSCVFYERDSGLCAIHRQAGAALLPVACQQFPRVSLLDARGLFVSVSHYCPTAARQLFRDNVPVRIVEAPPAFGAYFPYDPLDARSALPPLLRPEVLLDLEIYSRWETAAVEALGDDRRTPEQALTSIEAFTEALRTWHPGGVSLEQHFEGCAKRTGLQSCSTSDAAGSPARAAGPPEPGTHTFDEARTSAHYALVLEAIPREFRPTVPLGRVRASYERWVEGVWAAHGAPVRRYLASKLFASWLAYQGRGLRTIVYSVAVALSVLKANAALECNRAVCPLDNERLIAAIRRSDELLVHLASPEELARRLGVIEEAVR